jgi:hypothetical protein
MPAGTSWATFNQARLSGVTKTTQALGALYTERDPALVAALPTASPFTGLPAPFRGALSSLGLSQLELDHIRDWPDAQKERVRKELVRAIGAGDNVKFDERTEIRTTGPGTITISFFSPWSKVRPPGARYGPVAPDDVTIDVG